jgi:DNA-binding IclR family transcriptional regulator
MRVNWMNESNMPGGAQAVERALSVLEYVASAETPVTVSEIAQNVHLNRNTAYRLTRTLVARDYLEVDDGAYSLGPRLVVLSQSAAHRNVLLSKSDPHLQAVCDTLGEVVNLGIRRGDEVFYLSRWETSEPGLGVYVRTGQRAPLYASALGKVLLAAMPVEARAQYYRRCPFRAYTPHTLTTEADLDRAVRAAEGRGYAEDLEELSEGVRCLAVPIQVNDVVIAAASVSVPVPRFTEERRQRALGELTAAAERIGAALNPIRHGVPTVDGTARADG